jgi:muramoyltetrapeptide carboxypeptidase
MLGIVSPASTPKDDSVAAGVEVLVAMGYRTKVFPHALDRGPLYYAGTAADRLRDLHAAYADPEVDGILCTRGGWGAAELLPHLDRALIDRNSKALLGYSDITSLHVWLERELGRVSFQAPMVAADYSKPADRLPDAASWKAALEGASDWSVGADEGLRLLREGTGKPEGMLTGGCLSIYVEGLGTPYAPVNRGGVLFLEDIGTAPYQWDRMLVHLRLAGMLDGVKAIVFGDMAACVKEEEIPLMEGALLHACADFAGPLYIGLRSGHVHAGNVTLPFGVQVELWDDAEGNPRLHFLESAVAG